MSNQTTITEFLLTGFSNIREMQILHFVLFLMIYLASLIGNLLIITAIALDHHLHSPMYFFLMNLSILDIGSISNTVPKSMANSLLNTRTISYSGCVTQAFFIILFPFADIVLLTVMAYDRYIAICHPLHYERVMNRRVCVQMASGVWISGILMSALHTGNTFAISFCGGNMVDLFYCDVSQVLKLACPDSDLGENVVIFLNIFLTISCYCFIIVSYIQIFITVLRIPSAQGRHKAFATCIPHLTVILLTFVTDLFCYLKSSSSSTVLDLVVSVLYWVVPPVMNPVIYSLRNKAIKGALSKLIGRSLFKKE